MPFHPLYGVWSAVNHTQPRSRVTVEEAVRCFTYEGAFVLREEVLRGTIERGKLADIAIFEGDITGDWFKLESSKSEVVERIKEDMKCRGAWMTILDGEVVFRA
jgi:hypothetical protein